jgi:hypothetical protein
MIVKTMEKKLKRRKSPVKRQTLEEAKKLLLKSRVPDCDLETELKDFAEDIFPKLLHGNKKEKKEGQDKFNEKALGLMRILEVDTHVGLMESFNPTYRGLVHEMSKQIAKEYGVVTCAEKAITEVAVNAFVRVIDNSRRLNNCLEGGEFITSERTNYLAMLSKQIDRANRQFVSALVTLKQLKTPALEMNIKTKNAFVAQNQQINAESNPDTINEAK